MWLGGNYHYQAKRGHIILKNQSFLSSVCVYLNICVCVCFLTCDVNVCRCCCTQSSKYVCDSLWTCLCVCVCAHHFSFCDSNASPQPCHLKPGLCVCVCTPQQKTQYGRVSSAENGPLSSNCILLPRTLCLTLTFSMELYVKPLSPHTNTNTPACSRTHTQACTHTDTHLWKRG